MRTLTICVCRQKLLRNNGLCVVEGNGTLRVWCMNEIRLRSWRTKMDAVNSTSTLRAICFELSGLYGGRKALVPPWLLQNQRVPVVCERNAMDDFRSTNNFNQSSYICVNAVWHVRKRFNQFLPPNKKTRWTHCRSRAHWGINFHHPHTHTQHIGTRNAVSTCTRCGCSDLPMWKSITHACITCGRRSNFSHRINQLHREQ